MTLSPAALADVTGCAEFARLRLDGAELVLDLPAVGELVARRRRDGFELQGPGHRLDLALLVAAGEEAVWDLWLVAPDGERRRIGRRLDGVRGKRRIVRYPAFRSGTVQARPQFTATEDLAVVVGPAEPAGEGADAAARRVTLRRRLLNRPAIAFHRLALALVCRLPARRAPGEARERTAVRIVLTNAHAMGGTVRATLNLAGQLARRHEVELIAIRRRDDRPPFFPFPAGVTVTTLDDRTAPRRAIERLLARLP